MADDEKIIRIEGKLDEGKVPEPSAGSKLRDQEATSDPIRNREDYDQLAEDRSLRETLEKILGDKGTRSVEDTESFFPPQSPSPSDEEPLDPALSEPAVDPLRQIPADEIFGEGEQARYAKTAQQIGDAAEIEDLIGGFEAFNAAGAGSAAAEGGTAAAATAGGGAAATTAGATATATTAFTGALVTAGGILATFGNVLVGLITVYAGVTTLVTVAAELLSSAFFSLTEEFKHFSGTMRQADALQKIELLNTRLQEEEEVAPGYARVKEAETGVQQELIQIRSALSQIIAPVLVTLLEIVNALLIPIRVVLDGLNSFFALIRNFIEIVLPVVDLVKRVMEKILGWFGVNTNKPNKNAALDKFAQQFENLLIFGGEPNPPNTPPGGRTNRRHNP